MITIKEIADQLGVSATTVSNVLNGRAGKMSQETRQRVEEALLRNHYVKEKKNNRGEPQHHLVAVYICLGKKKHVLTDPFCGSLLEGIDRELRKYNRAMVCGTVDDNESFAKVLQNSNLEGAILLGCEAEFCTALVHQIPIPIVFVDSYGEGFDNIGLEDYEGGYEMTSYLIGQGDDHANADGRNDLRCGFRFDPTTVKSRADCQLGKRADRCCGGDDYIRRIYG